MSKVLIASFSHSGKTAKMAEFIAEGIRMQSGQAIVKNMGDIQSAADLAGYDGYIFGSPTYSLDIPGPVNSFLELAASAGLEGKPGGAFGAYKHEVGYQPGGVAAEMILDKMEKDFKMEPFYLGPLRMKEDDIETVDGMRACQDYGRVFGEKLG